MTLQIQKREYPLSLLKDLDKLYKTFQKLSFQYNDIIEEVKTEKELLYFRDKVYSSFSFQISNPNQTSDYRSFFNFSYFPESDSTFTIKTSFNNELAAVLENFNIWINLLKQYNEVNLSEEEYITKQYEDELFSEFEIIDDDAYTKPFENERQIFLYNLLTYVEDQLKMEKSDDTEIEKLIIETEDLKNNIQNLTKKNTIKRFSKILARVKKHGIKLFQEILNETKKEIIKRALTGGLDNVTSWIHHQF